MGTIVPIAPLVPPTLTATLIFSGKLLDSAALVRSDGRPIALASMRKLEGDTGDAVARRNLLI